MPRLKRIQLTFHTWEGEVVTTTQLEFDGTKTEYLTTASLSFLIEVAEEDIWALLNSNQRVMHLRHGQRWIVVNDVMWLLNAHRP